MRGSSAEDDRLRNRLDHTSDGIGEARIGLFRHKNCELIATKPRAAGSHRRQLGYDAGRPFKNFVSDNVPIKVVDLLEEVEVEEKQLTPRPYGIWIAEDPHQLASVSQPRHMVDKSVGMSSLLSELIARQGALQVLRPPPCEQDHGDVE